MINIINNTINSINELGVSQQDPTIQINGIIANTMHLLESIGADTSKIKSKLQEINTTPEE